MSSVARLLDFIEFKGLNKNQFCKQINLSNGYLDKVKELGADKIASIISFYPDIDPEWLLTGKGSMLRDAAQPHTPTPSLPAHTVIARATPEATSPCPELLAENIQLKATIAEKDRIISHLSKSMEALTTYINSLDKPLKNTPILQKDLVEKSK